MKAKLLALNHAYIFFISSIYVGLFWSLHFFWFPSFARVTLENYYDQMIPQTETATRFFFVVIPPMMLAIIVMLITEWKTRLRWVPIAWVIGLGVPIWVQQGPIENVNRVLKAGVTDPQHLSDLVGRWMMLNDVRMVILTAMWCITLYYFMAKGDFLAALDPKSASSTSGAPPSAVRAS